MCGKSCSDIRIEKKKQDSTVDTHHTKWVNCNTCTCTTNCSQYRPTCICMNQEAYNLPSGTSYIHVHVPLCEAVHDEIKRNSLHCTPKTDLVIMYHSI